MKKILQKNVCIGAAILCIFFGLCGSSVLHAQGREYIRTTIKNWGSCRNVAITKTNGDLALNGQNAYVSSGLPRGLSEALDELNERGEYIDDVVLTEHGRYLILYGNNGIVWNDIPYSLERKLREYNDKQEIIISVTFNDAGNWVVITTDHFSTSDTELDEWLKEGNERFGMLWSICITDDACVAVFRHGYRTFGNIPKTLGKALDETHLDVFRLKIAGSAWFFADMDGHFSYDM